MCRFVSVLLAQRDVRPDDVKDEPHGVRIGEQLLRQHVALAQLHDELIEREIGKPWRRCAERRPGLPRYEQREHRPVAGLQSPCGFECDQSAETMSEQDRRTTGPRDNVIGNVPGRLLHRLYGSFVKPIASARQLDTSDVDCRQPLSPIPKRRNRTSCIGHQEQADGRLGIGSRCKDPICRQRFFSPGLAARGVRSQHSSWPAKRPPAASRRHLVRTRGNTAFSRHASPIVISRGD